MMAFLVYLQQGGGLSVELAPVWEVTKGVMLSLATAAALWSARTLFLQRDDTRDLKREVAGILPTMERLSRRLDAVEKRNDREDWLDHKEMDRIGQLTNRRDRIRRQSDLPLLDEIE